MRRFFPPWPHSLVVFALACVLGWTLAEVWLRGQRGDAFKIDRSIYVSEAAHREAVRQSREGR